jgi:hypothetical protein
VSRPNLRYRLSSGSAERRDVALITAELCALNRSALNPEIKIESARKVMVKDLCTVLNMLGSSEW